MNDQQVEEFARVGWDDFYGQTNDPLWGDFTGPAKQAQISLAQQVALHGASPEHGLEMAYAKAYQDWQAKQPQPHADEPLKETKAAKTFVTPMVEPKKLAHKENK